MTVFSRPTTNMLEDPTATGVTPKRRSIVIPEYLQHHASTTVSLPLGTPSSNPVLQGIQSFED